MVASDQLPAVPRSLLRKLRNRLVGFYKRVVLKDRFSIEVRRWFRDRGDDTLRLDYPDLGPDSIVFDVGGYRGDFAALIHERYGCRVFVFEPHPAFHRACVDRFAAVEAIQPLNYGLSDIEGSFGLTDSVDGSSFISERKGDLPELECRLRALPDVLEELGVERIGLMKINIEGGEYDLLQSMADRDLFGRVDSLQIQFHDFAEDAVRRREAIQDALSRTHECTWCYDFVWENWKRLCSVAGTA